MSCTYCVHASELGELIANWLLAYLVMVFSLEMFNPNWLYTEILYWCHTLSNLG